MGNRRKPRKPWLSRKGYNPDPINEAYQAKIDLPNDQKVVLKTVPATVNGETIGEAVLYDDGTVDVKIDRDANPELIRILEGELNNLSIEDYKEN